MTNKEKSTFYLQRNAGHRHENEKNQTSDK